MAEAKKTSRTGATSRTKTASKTTKKPASKTSAKPSATRAKSKPAASSKGARAGAAKRSPAKGATKGTTKRPAKGAPVRKRKKELTETSQGALQESHAPVAEPEPEDRETRRRNAARELAKQVASAGLDKKAERIEIIDISDKADYADYLVLMSGRSDRQVKAVAQGIEDALKTRGVQPTRTEGMSQGHWVIVDFGDVIVHVFIEEARRHYDFDGLWMDARRVPFEGTPAPTTITTHVVPEENPDRVEVSPHWQGSVPDR